MLGERARVRGQKPGLLAANHASYRETLRETAPHPTPETPLRPRPATGLPTDAARMERRTELSDGDGVFRRTLLRLRRTVVATDGDLLTADLYLNSAILDFPFAYGALLRPHKISFQTDMNFRVAQTCAGDSHEDIVTGLKQSDFQILAHFAKCPATVVAA